MQSSGFVLTSVVSSPASAFIAEVFVLEAGSDLPETSENRVAFKTLRIAIDAKDGLQSRLRIKGEMTFTAAKSQANYGYDNADTLFAVKYTSGAAQPGIVTGEAYLEGDQVAHSLFRYDTVRAPDIPVII